MMHTITDANDHQLFISVNSAISALKSVHGAWVDIDYGIVYLVHALVYME